MMITGNVGLCFGGIMRPTETDSIYQPPQELSVPAMVYPYKAGVIGGAMGGFVMIVIAALYGLISGHGLWLPVNLIGATLMRDLQAASLDQLSAFNATGLFVGLVLHMAMSIGLGLIFAMLLPTLPGSPVLWALLIGPLLWALASVLILPFLNPVMALYVDHTSFFGAHLVYSLVLGWWIGRTPKVRA
jgi:hypothetical protein